MAVSVWLQDVGAVAAGRERFHAFLDEVIRELHLRRDDPEMVSALAHDLNLSRDEIERVIAPGETARTVTRREKAEDAAESESESEETETEPETEKTE